MRRVVSWEIFNHRLGHHLVSKSLTDTVQKNQALEGEELDEGPVRF